MLKFLVILLVSFQIAYSERVYTELFLGEMLDDLEPLIKDLCDQWAMSLYESDAFVRRDAPSTPNVLDSLQKNMAEFKNCIDQTLAKTVDEVNVKQVQPIFEVFGEHLNKLSKAFEDLTATKAPYRK